MKLAILKKVRVALSLAFFLWLSVLFFDIIHEIEPAWFDFPLYLQFIPSFLEFVSVPELAAAGFLIVIVLTLLFGRIYCSSICPLGTLQDIINYIHRKIKRKKNFEYKKANNYLRYGILGIAIAGVVFGLITPLIVLDPYSNFMRMMSALVMPIAISINNLAAAITQPMGIHFFHRIDVVWAGWQIIAFPVVILLIIGIMTIWRGRLWCNTICPVGAFLGLFSKYSLFKIRFAQAECTNCSLCEKRCKAECIDYENMTVDDSRCISCFNCIQACPVRGLTYSYSETEGEVPEAEPVAASQRRRFINSLPGAVLGVGLVPMLQTSNPYREKLRQQLGAERRKPATPPGSISTDNFNSRCTACHACVAVCPTNVIQPAWTDHGIEHMLQPKMDYHAGYCNYDCVRCSEICPTGAIRPIAMEEKKRIQIGIAELIKSQCIVYADRTDCGACAEHCPTKAVHMVPWRDNLRVPRIRENTCVGCGACEYACPTNPRAIFVVRNEEHLTADEPKFDKIDREVDEEEDFPF